MQCFITVTEDVQNYLDYKKIKKFLGKKVGNIGNPYRNFRCISKSGQNCIMKKQWESLPAQKKPVICSKWPLSGANCGMLCEIKMGLYHILLPSTEGPLLKSSEIEQ